MTARAIPVAGRKMVPITFPDALPLDGVDADGKDILAVGFDVRERGTSEVRKVLCHWPVWSDWDDFGLNFATILSLISTRIGDLKLPDDIKASIEDGSMSMHLKILSGAIRMKSVRDQIKVCLQYLDPIVEPAPDDHWDWLEKNMTIMDCQNIFGLLVAVTQEIEKKTKFILMNLFPNRMSSASDSVLPKSSESQYTKPRGFQSSGSGPRQFGPPNLISESQST